MDILGAAVTDLLNDPVQARDVIYRPAGGAARTIRAATNRRGEILPGQAGGRGIVTEASEILVAAVAVPELASGDGFDVDGKSFRVRQYINFDRHGRLLSVALTEDGGAS